MLKQKCKTTTTNSWSPFGVVQLYLGTRACHGVWWIHPVIGENWSSLFQQVSVTSSFWARDGTLSSLPILSIGVSGRLAQSVSGWCWVVFVPSSTTSDAYSFFSLLCSTQLPEPWGRAVIQASHYKLSAPKISLSSSCLAVGLCVNLPFTARSNFSGEGWVM